MTQRERIAIWPSDRASRVTVKPTETLTGTRTLTVPEIEKFQAFSFDPGGAARDLNLPAVGACAGVVMFISNKADAAEIISIKNVGGDTIVTPTQNEACIVWCDGTGWYGLVGSQA
jgi:hypothetical protein